MSIPDSARAVIESGRLAHLVTINRDASPHVTIVWVGLDGDDIVIGKLMRDQKIANIGLILASRSPSRPKATSSACSITLLSRERLGSRRAGPTRGDMLGRGARPGTLPGNTRVGPRRWQSRYG
jgi:hypothetical protein